MARTRPRPAETPPGARTVTLLPAPEPPPAPVPPPAEVRSQPLAGHEVHALQRKDRPPAMVTTRDERVLHQLRKAGRLWRAFAFGAGVRELVEGATAEEAKETYLAHARDQGHDVPAHALRVQKLAE